ncbi:MAG: chorismate synthase [Bacteroidetes bacterium RIFCSPLOWO2_02_FULL_36_8]|nr:MAG: chorismate synthase [Bacteroidetes bacterium RIFCSPLOWO2_02_FULL_36_8]OFY69688.1 MAG: chorismate synthase [Bacteroidetes bacterium RIFCSPLOWO2_12_FULL_37_12]
MNTFGQIFRVTTFGESHGPAVGVVIDGCPAGLEIQKDYIQSELNRRRPGQSYLTTTRNDPDEIKILSGFFENKTTGAPICLMVYNEDQKESDYDHLVEIYRPSHADFTYQEKYGIRDHRGGGRSSARETLARVAAGAISKKLLRNSGVKIFAYVESVGKIKTQLPYQDLDFNLIDSTPVRCPDLPTAQKMMSLIEKIKKEGDTLGGVIKGVIKGTPVGWGEPVFDKLHADLAKAMMSINAVHGFEYGSGFEGTEMPGSMHNDVFTSSKGKISTKTNFSGGIQGGISNGQDIYFRVAFKPVATLMQNQSSVTKEGKTVIVKGKGRHDPCVLPRAVPIVEAMAGLVLADHSLRNRCVKL